MNHSIKMLAVVSSLGLLAMHVAQAQTTATRKQTSAELTRLQDRTFSLAITDSEGKTLTGTLAIAGRNVERQADDASFTAPEAAFDDFFAVPASVRPYYHRFAVNGQLSSGVFVFAGAATLQRTVNSVEIVIGAPVPGSLSGGAGIADLPGALLSNGALSGKAAPAQGFLDSFLATPTN